MPTEYKLLSADDARTAQITQLVIRVGDRVGLDPRALGDSLAYIIPALSDQSILDEATMVDTLGDLRVTAPYFFKDIAPAPAVHYVRHGRKLSPAELIKLPARERLDIINEAEARAKKRA